MGDPGSDRPEARAIAGLLGTSIFAATAVLPACQSPTPAERERALVARGEEIFFTETFDGNGRTCGTCHRAEDNFAITPGFIATLPDDDPLFVAEFKPDLAENFERPALMREFGLILENLDGFDDLENRFVLRGVPHVLALRTSVESDSGPRTGWSGDGAPGDGSLRSFAVGAVIQHFPRTLNRVAGVDFRLPTGEELDALEAFMLSLGRQEDRSLPLPLKDTVAVRGQEIFLDDTLGKCGICHVNAGATANLGGRNVGNANFDTGVEDLPDKPADLTGGFVPPDDGFGTPGDGTFNTPPLVEAADTGPFFHDNSIQTVEGAVAFYNGDAFNGSPAGRFLASSDPRGVGIRLDATQLVAVAAFLRVINALENVRVSLELLEESSERRFLGRRRGRELLDRAAVEMDDALSVLAGAGLHPRAVSALGEARELTRKASASHFSRRRLTREAARRLEEARSQMIEGRG